MTRRLLLLALFLAALVLALSAWAVAGARWLVAAPVRRARRRDELPFGRLAS